MRSAPIGAAAVHINIISQLHNSISHSLSHAPLSPDIAEEITIQGCFIADTTVSKVPHDITYSHTNGATLKVPGQVRGSAFDVIFNGDDEGVSIATLVLDSLKKSPKDARMALAHNILLLGGVVMASGFHQRFLNAISHTLENIDYAEIRGLQSHFNFVASKFPPNYLGWLGGAIIGTVEQPTQKITKDVYTRNSRQIPDWSKLSKLTLI